MTMIIMMATAVRRCGVVAPLNRRQLNVITRYFGSGNGGRGNGNSVGVNNIHNKNVPKYWQRYLWLIGGGVLSITCANLLKTEANTVQASKLHIKQANEETSVRLTMRERRFIKFSSVEFDEQLYMTPQDFIDSMVEQEPRPRLKRRTLVIDDIKKIREATPALKKGSPRLFRNLRDKGLISYTEYLFLLSALTKPESGFRIAFNMFDTDGNKRVDKDEFLVIRKILGGSLREHDMDETTQRILTHLVSTQEQASNLIVKRKRKGEAIEEPELKVNLQRKYEVVTTLQTHFFGPKGDKVLHYDGFHKFLNNLQTEVLEIEFNEFAKGQLVISELDFAKILLRYTYLDTNQYDAFLERLLDRMRDEKGITFKEFLDFCRFLNNLEDFAIAMNMYNLADHSISKDEFSRAVKICTGYKLSKHLIDTVFAIFDRDGDGRLSHEEFIAIMKDRLHRGFKSTPRNEGWDAFKYCVKTDIRNT